jgi:hypothetical protein
MYKNKPSILYRRSPSRESWWFYPLLIVGTIGVLGLAMGAGYFWGAKIQPQQYVEQFRGELKHQWEALEEAELTVRTNLDALTHRIGMLQAHVTRLNALGSKMVSIAKLKPGEFDFEDVPAMGGAGSELYQTGIESESISRVLESLELALMEKEQQLQYLDEMMLSKNLQDAVRPKGTPVTEGWISSRYGYRTDPFTGRRQFHRGIDFAGSEGTPIYAAAGGIVINAKKHPQYGNLVEIDHRNGYVTRYAHTSKMLVKAGDVVKKGQEIAKMGSTGRSTGTHLHFEVIKNGSTTNPALILEKRKKQAKKKKPSEKKS